VATQYALQLLETLRLNRLNHPMY